MSSAGLPMIPPPGVTGWTVPIDMPVFEKGKKVGRPVGWLNANDPPTSRWAAIEHSEIRRLWRQAAWKAYTTHRLPRDVGRIYLTIQFQFADRTKRDLPNFELTLKPIIDALQPERREVRKKKIKGGGFQLTTVHHRGRGVVPDDDRRWIVRGPEQDVLPPIGRGAPIGGRVVITITPLPAAPTLSKENPAA